MTELIPNKRYRWTVEGTANEYGLTLPSGGLLMAGTLADGETELLPDDPLPTTPGSVVQMEHMILALRVDGNWAVLDSEGGWYTPNEMRESTVLFDARADL